MKYKCEYTRSQELKKYFSLTYFMSVTSNNDVASLIIAQSGTIAFCIKYEPHPLYKQL